MLKNFAMFFVAFGLSFLIQSWGWTEQGIAFICIHLGLSLLIGLVIVLFSLVVGDGIIEKAELSVLTIFIFALGIGLSLFATWGATKLFDVNFTVAYQIMTFGRCLTTSSKKDKDD